MSFVAARRASALAALLVFGAPAAAFAGHCKSYSGDFTAVRPADCASPLGICTHGTLTGDFPGTYDLVIDGANPDGTLFGHDVIRAANGGTILGEDSVTLVPNGDGTGNFVTTVDIVDGTRRYSNASGQFVAQGVLDLTTGATEGTYTAVVCKGGGTMTGTGAG